MEKKYTIEEFQKWASKNKKVYWTNNKPPMFDICVTIDDIHALTPENIDKANETKDKDQLIIDLD